MASGSSRPLIDQFFPAKKLRPSSRKDDPPGPASQHGSPGSAKGSLEGFVVRSPPTRAVAAPASAAPASSPRGEGAGAGRSLSAAMDIDVGSLAPVVALTGGGADLEFMRFTTDFLSHCCSAISPFRDDPGYHEQWGKKQKRSVAQSFLFPCDNAPVKKQRVAGCDALETLKDLDDNMALKKQCTNHNFASEAMEESVEGGKVSCPGLSVLQRCSFTPNTAHKKVGFSLVHGETPKSLSRNSLTSPGEEFWNAAIEFADGISAHADKVRGRPEFDATEDKSSCAVAVCSKTRPRSGKDELDCQNTVGSNDAHQNKVEAVSEQHIISSPLPVKHLDFFHEDDIQALGLKCEEKGSNEACNVRPDHIQLKDSGRKRKNLIDSVDAMKKSFLDLHADSATMIRCQGVFKSINKAKVHSTREGDKDSHLIQRDLHQPICNENKTSAAYSNVCKANKDPKSKFASQELEASTPTSSVPLKDHSKLSSWLPPELCAIYMKKGISELYPWQVECLLVEGVLEKRNLVYCASTSAGKSFVAEVLMLRRILSSGNMAILVLPYVSICAEKAEHLEQLLEPLGRHVRSFYGNQGGGSLPKDTAVAVCTIEKANSLVNKLLEDGRLSELGVIVIDELHMVGDQHRGYLLELMLTKLRYAAGEGNSESSSGETSGSSSGKMSTHGLQIIGMSATMPNVAAVADWLQHEQFAGQIYFNLPLWTPSVHCSTMPEADTDAQLVFRFCIADLWMSAPAGVGASPSTCLMHMLDFLNPDLDHQLHKLFLTKGLGEDVSELLAGLNMPENNLPSSDTLPDEMEAVFAPVVEEVIFTRILHEPAYIAHGERQVRPLVHQIAQAADNAPVARHVHLCCRALLAQLDLLFHRCLVGPATRHAAPLSQLP
ncbi:hypothetical protein U9M48_035851 [Paspalum notatum var. saurae]|uniref:Helicase ATP-binding domain-containing protein n=1 Tax=Paspalum notatum var. saurae TaxID=547442 RepID=A0AAQ3UBV8_PASNO